MDPGIEGNRVARGEFSVIVALYEVEHYVDAFLKSMEAGTYPFEDLQVIIVDDGSPDASLAIVQTWIEKYPDVIRAVSKPNGGPGSARNLGLTMAANTWVTFPDPDDTLHPNYFQEVALFISKDRSQRCNLLTTRLVQHVDGTFITNHKHTLDWKFRRGNRMISLDSNPNYVHLSGGTAFARRSVIEDNGLRFDEAIRPKFEDAHFIGRYLVLVGQPIVGVVAKARYFYRKRADGSSLVQSAWSNPGVYDEVPRLGYLGLLKFAKRELGYVPRWAQAMVLYELVWAYVEQKQMHSATGAISDSQRLGFLATYDEIMKHIDAEAIEDFAAVGQGWIFHNILRSSSERAQQVPKVVVRWSVDFKREFVRYSYPFIGGRPEEVVLLNGKPTEPLAAKVIAHDFFGRVGVYERVFYVPYGEISVLLNGELARIVVKPETPIRGSVMPLGIPRHGNVVGQVSEDCSIGSPKTTVGEGFGTKLPAILETKIRSLEIYRRVDEKLAVQSILLQSSKLETATSAARRIGQRVVAKGVDAWSKSASQRQLDVGRSDAKRTLYKKAWILIDSPDRADDNAEHLYRYIAANRQDINVWFVLERNSKDWGRLEREGFKLLEYGSMEAASALHYASFNISSHADRPVQYPPHYNKYGNPKAKIVFLQHGVTKDDLSRWLNPKMISLIITATHDEYHSFAGDDTNYKYTAMDVACTGFPRHDQLRRLADAAQGKPRRNILIAPTWRQYLSEVFDAGISLEEQLANFEKTAFGKNWLRLLRSSALRDLAYSKQLNIRFLAHPNLAKLMPTLDLPEYVEILSYPEISVQTELVSSAVLISDYSSLAFEAAIADANVIHFQFDGNEIFAGGHPYRKGYFDYEVHGFGPRLENADEVVEELNSLANRNFEQSRLYADRINGTFKFMDYSSSERTVRAIESLDQHWWEA